MAAPRLTVDRYVAGVREGDRTVLARAITLIESTLPADQALAAEVLARLLPESGGATRVGISGVPGVGKSTFIETLGMDLIDQGRRVAVLAVDPTSSRSGGSILGDKSRMQRLAAADAAFIRPSPNARTLGGVARRTRESMLLCEAAGFDVVLIETVGVGQSETAVADMVDFFLLLLLPGAGDELQGIKRGIVELADLVAVNKADGVGESAARHAVSDYGAALHYLRAREDGWVARVVAISGLTGAGVHDLWGVVEEHRAARLSSGQLHARRRDQSQRWLWSLVEERVLAAFRAHPEVARIAPGLERAVVQDELPVSRAAEELLRAFGIDPAADSGSGSTSAETTSAE